VDITTLPEMSETYNLAKGDIEAFRRDGHILLRGVASPEEVSAYRPAIAEAVERFRKDRRPLTERDTYGKAFIQVGNLWTKSEAVKRFVFAKRFARIAAELMGVPAVRLYHDQALFKEPGGGYTPWHQDQVYWPLDTENTITMWMPLVPLTREAGTLDFVSGSHRLGYITKQVISDASHKTLAQFIESRGLPVANHGPMQPGDATFHYGWTVHAAPGNGTNRMREVMTIIYYADGARLLEPDTHARRLDRDALLPDVEPGEPAAGKLTPLLYSSEENR